MRIVSDSLKQMSIFKTVLVYAMALAAAILPVAGQSTVVFAQEEAAPAEPAAAAVRRCFMMTYPTPNVLCLVIKREKTSEIGMFCSFVKKF